MQFIYKTLSNEQLVTLTAELSYIGAQEKPAYVVKSKMLEKLFEEDYGTCWSDTYTNIYLRLRAEIINRLLERRAFLVSK